jgi:hypothetical protein
LLQHEYGDRVIFLRGNHETEDINYVNGLRKEFIRIFPILGTTLWAAVNKTFDKLPLVAIVGKRLFCHGAVSEITDYDLKNLDKKRIEENSIDEISVIWSDIDFGAKEKYDQGARDQLNAFTIGTQKESKILSRLKFNGEKLGLVFLGKGHSHPDSGKCCRDDATGIKILCVIGSYNRDEKGFGYAKVEPNGDHEHIIWNVR